MAKAKDPSQPSAESILENIVIEQMGKMSASIDLLMQVIAHGQLCANTGHALFEIDDVGTQGQVCWCSRCHSYFDVKFDASTRVPTIIERGKSVPRKPEAPKP